MATTKRTRRSSDTPANRKPAASPESHSADVVVLEAGDAALNDAPTLTLPTMGSRPEPEFVPPAAPAPSQPSAPPAEAAAPAPALSQPSAPPAEAAAPAPAAPLPAAPASLPAMSPAEERATFQRRRAVALASLVVGLLLIGFLAYRFFAPQAASTPSAPPAPQAAAPQSNNPAPPAPQAAAPQANNPAPPAPQAAAPQANGEVVGGCSAVAGLPVFSGATCTKQKQDTEDGVVKLENTYTISAAADDVRRFYEGAFTQNGWSITESKQDLEDQQWEYTVEQNARKVKVKIEAKNTAQANGTELQIDEK